MIQVIDGPREPWLRSILTDREGNFDMGAVLVVVVTLYMCASSFHDTFIMSRAFDAERFGIGVAAMLGGFGVYKWGDRPGAYSAGAARSAGKPDAGAGFTHE
jgi:hypothetical protein